MDKRAIDFTPGQGLGNRLLSIAFAKAIGKVNSINWIKTDECNADFYDLFSAPRLPIVTSDDLSLYYTCVGRENMSSFSCFLL